jgi:hypothetical protein
MTPLPDRIVIVAIVGTVALVFALVFWSVRLQPTPEAPLLWRQPPAAVRSGGTTL